MQTPIHFNFVPNPQHHEHNIVIGVDPSVLPARWKQKSKTLLFILEKGTLVKFIVQLSSQHDFFCAEVGDREYSFVSNNAKPTRAEALGITGSGCFECVEYSIV
jgi:hypothetical protein